MTLRRSEPVDISGWRGRGREEIKKRVIGWINFKLIDLVYWLPTSGGSPVSFLSRAAPSRKPRSRQKAHVSCYRPPWLRISNLGCLSSSNMMRGVCVSSRNLPRCPALATTAEATPPPCCPAYFFSLRHFFLSTTANSNKIISQKFCNECVNVLCGLISYIFFFAYCTLCTNNFKTTFKTLLILWESAVYQAYTL